MTKAELIERIARSKDVPAGITKKDIGQILALTFEELAQYFSKTRVTKTSSPRFTFPRFGTFTKKKRSARRGVNPRTLEPIQIDACVTVDFKASRELRTAMNATGSARAKTGSVARKRTAPSDPRAELRSTGRRRLTPRDEDAELDALIDDSAVFEEAALPEARLQRVRQGPDDSRRSRVRTTG